VSTDALYTFYKTWGSNILFRYRKNGKSYAKKVDFYKPSLYTKADASAPGDTVPSIFGYDLKRVQFDSIRDAKGFVNSYKDVEGFTIEGNSNYANQFIIELYDGKMPEFDPSQIRVGILDIEVNVPDGEGFPEPAEVKWPINGITFYDNFTDTYYCIGDKEYVHDAQDKDVGHLKVEYQRCDGEVSLLKAMLRHFKEFNYDATSGWNSETFDMPYIVNRCYKILGEETTKSHLSPFNHIELREVNGNFGKPQLKADIMGVPHLDFLQLYKKHIYVPRESYRLDFIGNAELGMSKMSYEEEGSLRALYEQNPQKFYSYNIKDTALVKALNDKLGLFNITFTLAYYCLANYEETLGTTKIWEQLIAKQLYVKGQVPLFAAKRQAGKEFDGAFVHPTVVGFHRWLVSIDLNSLYPMNEIQYNIGPNTYIPRERLPACLQELKSKYTLDDLVHKRVDLSDLAKYNLIMAGNFEFYDRSYVGFMAEIKDELYTGRKVKKKLMLKAQTESQRVKAEMKVQGMLDDLVQELKKWELQDGLNGNLQLALKILLNAGYGAIGNEHFLYYKVENAEAITLSGQLINKWTHVRVNALLNKMLGTVDVNRTVAGDTDSLYLVLDDVVEMMGIRHMTDNEIADQLDQFMKQVLSPKVDQFSQELCEYMNGMQNKMVWEREVISPISIFVRKKGYTMSIIDSEGVRFTEPKFKVTGLEAVKSSTPEWSRNYLKECYKIALTRDQNKLHARVAEIRQEFMKLSVNDIAIPRGVNNLEKYTDDTSIYIKGTPKHVKAALVHNHLVKSRGMNTQLISGGNKIKFIDLKRPNPINQDVVGFNYFLPAEFELDKFVDRDTIFDTAFMSPLLIFLEAIKWSHEPVISLEDFFS
jgi:DNA polymerase elongation subunit (family B)